MTKTLQELLDKPRRWQPIETQPKGHITWLGNESNITTGFWKEGKEYEIPDSGAGGGWIKFETEGVHFKSLWFEPTHWRPVPTLPTEPDAIEQIITGLCELIKQKDEALTDICSASLGGIHPRTNKDARIKTVNTAREALLLTPETMRL